MFDRAQLKENAKKILSKNYWWIVLVTLIVGISLGTETSPNINFNIDSLLQNYVEQDSVDESIFGEDIFGDQGIENEFYEDEIMIEDFFSSNEFIDGIITASVIMLPIFAFIFVIVFIVTYCMFTFLLNPLQVGCRKWFLTNRTEKPNFIEVVSGFRYNYWNVVKVMFVRDVKITLWSLLFIIPGIIKSYEYRMVPYLLAENPNMSTKEALEASRQLMDGNKIEAWVLDLSFIGWRLLSILTCGILNIFYVDPYVALADTELYVCLCQGKDNYHV